MQTQAFLKAVSSVGVFLLLAVPGFLLTKKKILTGRQVEGLSSVLVNFLWPAMVAGVTRFRRRARRAHSTFREGRYFTAKMAARRPSTVIKTPVSIFRSRGRAMRRFFMK